MRTEILLVPVQRNITRFLGESSTTPYRLWTHEVKQGEKASNHERRVLRVASCRLGSLDLFRRISRLGYRKDDIWITLGACGLTSRPTDGVRGSTLLRPGTLTR